MYARGMTTREIQGHLHELYGVEVSPTLISNITDAVLEDPDPADWLMWRRTLDGWGYSPLDQISRGNVGELRMVWSRALSPGLQQGTPLVYDGVMYMPNPNDVIQAIDAVTGDRGELVDRMRALESDLEDVALSADDAIRDAEARQRELESSIRVLDRRIAAKEDVQGELRDRIADYEEQIRKFEREEYLMAILIENLVAEELRRSAPDLTKESGQGFIMPMEGRIGSGFGMRTHPIFGTKRMHNGIDIGCVRGQPIWAAKAGKVIYAGWKNGYGNVVLLEHEGPVITLYAHQESLHVSAGYAIGKGDVIGTCGSTGWSTGPHLHFEVRTGGEPKDPMIVLPG